MYPLTLELLYLESGNIPIRFILMSKRLNFLHYILNEEEGSLIGIFFTAQCENPTKKDWVSSVKEDLKNLEIEMKFEDIKKVSKDTFMHIVKEHVKEAAFKYLTKIQSTHTKAENIKFKTLELQDYLKSESDMTINEKSFAFAARSRMIDVKCNFKFGKADLKCRKCLIQDETQEHLLSFMFSSTRQFSDTINKHSSI